MIPLSGARVYAHAFAFKPGTSFKSGTLANPSIINRQTADGVVVMDSNSLKRPPPRARFVIAIHVRAHCHVSGPNRKSTQDAQRGIPPCDHRHVGSVRAQPSPWLCTTRTVLYTARRPGVTASSTSPLSHAHERRFTAHRRSPFALLIPRNNRIGSNRAFRS